MGVAAIVEGRIPSVAYPPSATVTLCALLAYRHCPSSTPLVTATPHRLPEPSGPLWFGRY
jgi:hypothetical protein